MAAAYRAVLEGLGYAPMPWANGGGTTWEVAREPANGDFSWRISIAEIDADGPFSPLPGVDRLFTLASRDTIRLTINGEERPVPFGSPVGFAGDDAVCCSVRGPALALNVMTRRGRASATIEIVAGPAPLATDATMLVVLSGPAKLPGDAGSRSLSPLQAVAIGQGLRALTGEGTVAVIRIVS